MSASGRPGPEPDQRAPDARRIVVVGPCASGKSTLASALRSFGYDAHVSGQEHSEIAKLWRRLKPDVMIALTVDAATVRERRGTWPDWLHHTQERRLASAMASADLTIDTAVCGIQETVALALQHLETTKTA